MGTLALVGSGEYLPGMEDVDRFLLSRLAGPARVVCLPTAAGTEGAERIQYWIDLGVAHFQKLGVDWAEGLPVVDHASACDVTFARRIDEANFVYLSGGKPPYLYQSLAGTPVWDAITGVLERGGVVVGCSAGAMIFGERLLSGPGRMEATNGFGYLHKAYVIPHYDELPAVVVQGAALLLRSWTMVGVDGYTALVAGPTGLSVHGKGRVEIRLNGEKKVMREKL
jgi:peptidase E